MFNCGAAGESKPKRVSSDHDPLFRFHRWLANLRVMEIDEIKSVPRIQVSHPFVARLIGTIRREYLDRMFFWNAVDLARKLGAFKFYSNGNRCHQAPSGGTPSDTSGHPALQPASLDDYLEQHCREIFQTPIAA